MPILAINLSPKLRQCVEKKSTIQLRIASNIQQALVYLAYEDFRLVIEDTRQNDVKAENDLAHLVAATTPGTPIIALASKASIPDYQYWQSQGITLLYQEPCAEDLYRLLRPSQ